MISKYRKMSQGHLVAIEPIHVVPLFFWRSSHEVGVSSPILVTVDVFSTVKDIYGAIQFSLIR